MMKMRLNYKYELMRSWRKMKNRIEDFFKISLLIILVFNVIGCSRVLGPSDEEAIKAINDIGIFAGGVEKFTLKSPMVILSRGSRNSDGSWPVTVKMTLTYTMADGHEREAKERTSTYRLYKSKDSSGKTVWKAVSGS